MSLMNKNGTYEMKRNIIQHMYNIANRSINSIVIILINNKLVQVVNEWEIKTSIRMHFRENYDKVNSAMETFDGTLRSKKIETLMKYVRTIWCSHLIQDKKFDILKLYDVSNQAKVSVKKRNKTTPSEVDSFHGRFSVLSALLTPFKLQNLQLFTPISLRIKGT